MFNPVIAMLHNTTAQRWHPVLFNESSLPGPDAPDKPVRHKSRMHHTTGFPTREEALDNARTSLADAVRTQGMGEPEFCLDKDFPWDGEGIPAMVVFFVKHGDVLESCY